MTPILLLVISLQVGQVDGLLTGDSNPHVQASKVKMIRSVGSAHPIGNNYL